ncbi:hypothetical protein PN482_04585, partial [Microcystis aeruginosa CS-555/01A07]|uniref:hypothetical protein n=1 Tax=Microcystis aeruginosa TaxID=1126 RepID=UPI00233081CE
FILSQDQTLHDESFDSFDFFSSPPCGFDFFVIELLLNEAFFCLAFKLLFCLGSSVVCFASLSLCFNRAFTNVSNFPWFVNPLWQFFLIFFLSLAT